MRIYKSYELTTMCQLRKHNPNYDFENDEVKMFEMKSSSQDEPPEHLADYETPPVPHTSCPGDTWE